ncbi:Galactose mutarotase [Linum perenne]
MKTTATAAAEQVVHIYKPLIRRRKQKKTDKKIKSSEMGKFILMIVLLCLSLLVVVAYGSSSSSSEEKIGIYELKKGNMSLRVTNYGAHVISLVIPDKYGKLKDVILGYDTAVAYKNDTTNFGATVGRVANRIGGAQFTLNGTLYKLVPNEGNNILHGGPVGFGKVVWKVKDYQPNASRPFIVFQYKSPDGDQGFPGDVVALVKYTLMEHRQLSIKMKARALNKATPVNLANHAYWNLAGHDSGDILSHELQIFASHYTPVDDHLIPTGKIDSVVRTPYDFITPKSVGSRIGQLKLGYDINYALRGNKRGLRKAAVVHDTKSGRVMELFTNQPGVQLYTSGQLVDTKGKGGVVYKKHGGLCLETQGYPDAVNHPNFPSTIVTPSNPYHHSMLLRFSTS